MEEFVNGKIILIDKPLKWSSFQVVNKLKWAILKKFRLKKIKIGHAGTLDPLATGLLIICTGKFTKKIEEIQAQSKVYTGTITLGATTPSYDLETEPDKFFPTDHISPDLVEKIRTSFLGEIEQYPPMFSAIKKEGKRLYELAREGKKIEIQARKIQIYDLKLVFVNQKELSFEVKCSKGTYIRSLAHDIGEKLNSGGYLSSLKRVKIGDFSLENALSPDEFINKHIDFE